MQYLSLVASSDAVTDGTYQLMLDGESSECIPFDASESQMEDAIKSFEDVGGVDVVATAAPNESQL